MGATAADARRLLDAVGSELPVVAFTSVGVEAARSVLTEAGFGSSPITEAVMCLLQPPAAVDSQFRVEQCRRAEQIEQALRLNAEAHQIGEMLTTATSAAFASSHSTLWMAHDDREPVSTVSICRHGAVLGVMEMMTPARHQRRGAGRALLSAVLRELWDADIDRAVLFTSAAGRRLYVSMGFVTADETVTCFRGLDDEVLEAIGQSA